MSNIIMPEEDWVDLLDAIREKGGTSALMTSAQAIAAVEAISGGGGGASGWALLASGSYTKTNTAAALTIPVSFSGTPKIMCVRVQEELTDTGQALAAFKYIDMPNSEMAAYGAFAKGAAQARTKNSSNAYSYATVNTEASTLSATTMTWQRVTSSLLWQPNTYDWWIYGEATV